MAEDTKDDIKKEEAAPEKEVKAKATEAKEDKSAKEEVKADAKEPKVKAEKTEAKAAPAKRSRKKPKRRIVPEGRAYIQAGFNNTIITITDPNGEVLCWSSAGANGFKGPKKATPFAAQTSAEKTAEKAKMYGVEKVEVFIKGAGNGREQSMRGLLSGGITIDRITDVTAVPHNGCRQKKTRRV